MRIAMLSHQWPGARMGGIGAAVAQSAAALAGAGHEVHVFTLTLPQDVRGRLPAGIQVHEVDGLPVRMADGRSAPQLAAALNTAGEGAHRLGIAWLLAEALDRVHRDQPFDIVEAPEVEALGLPLMMPGGLEVPVVTHMHCCTASARAANALSSLRAGQASSEIATTVQREADFATALEFAAIHLADGVCAPTAAVVRDTEQFIRVRPDVRIVPHAFICPASAFVPPPDDAPILFVGRIERLKGVLTIAAALNRFLPKHRSATFRFVGPDTATGPRNGSMRRQIEGQLLPSIAARVAFAGELSPAQVAEEWRRCALGVLPSLRENFSMACCEAMAAGRTVIVGAGTGSVELVGDAGIAIGSAEALADAMEQLWTDRAQRDRLSRAAFDRVRQVCAPARVAEARVAFYEACIADFGGAAGRMGRMTALPPTCATAILPALCNLAAALTGVSASRPPTPGERLLRIMEGLARDSERSACVLLYGAGKHTHRLLAERHVWESRGHRVVGLIDDHPRFAESPVYLDLPVQSIKRAAARAAAGEVLAPVVLSTDTYEDQFWDHAAPLRAAGTAVFRLYS